MTREEIIKQDARESEAVNSGMLPPSLRNQKLTKEEQDMWWEEWQAARKERES